MVYQIALTDPAPGAACALELPVSPALAFVTGSGRGLGRTIAGQLAELRAEIADAVTFVADPRSKFIHGQVLRMDGGMALFAA